MSAERDRPDWKGQLRSVKHALQTTSEPRNTGSVNKSPPRPNDPRGKPENASLPRKTARVFRKQGKSRAKMPLLPKWARKYCEQNGINPAHAVVENGRLQIRRMAPTPAQTSPTIVKAGMVNIPQTTASPTPWPWLTASVAQPRFTGLASAKNEAAQWLSRGTRIQVSSDPADAKSTIRVLVGLDIGTAYTKVVAKVGSSDRYAISFDQAVECGDRSLLPAVLSIDAEGVAWLGDISHSVRRFDDLKLRVIQRDDTQDQDAAFVAFIALVLRAARAWLFENKTALLASRSIDWGYNVGMPTLPWEKSGFREKYQKLVEAALCASVTDGPIRLDVCERFLRHLPQLATGLRNRICVFAEFAAQITGYVNSPRRREGPHLLVDVGAGTMDVTMFNVFQPPVSAGDSDEDEAGNSSATADTRFPIWDARVERLGSHYLSIARSVARGGTSANAEEPIEVGETMEPLESYCKATGADRQLVEQMENRFSAAVFEKIKAVIDRTKMERYSRFPWAKETVPTFICGGGSRYPLYESAVVEAAGKSRVKLERLPLPVPESLRAQGVRDNLFDRLSVAHGLSFEPMEIGEIVPSHQIENQLSQVTAAKSTSIHEIDLTDRDQSE